MRHFRLVGISLIAVLAVMSIVPAAAQSPADLNALARYFPADTPVFISVRTDDDFINTLDSVIARVQAAFPDMESEETLSSALDEMAGTLFPGGSFNEDLRPLLGDTASIGITSAENMVDDNRSNDDDTPAIVALSIQDSQAVIDLIGERSEMQTQQTTGDGYTLFTADNSSGGDVDDAIIVRDDVLLFYTTDTTMPEGGLPDGDLAASTDFTDALGILPEPAYNMTVYLDLATFFEVAAQNDPEAAQAMSSMGPMFNAIGNQVWGFTILGGDTLTMDVASQIGDVSALEDLGLSMGSMTPVDTAFAARVPANVPLAIFGTDIQTSLTSAAASLQFAAQQSATMDNGDFDVEEFEQGIAQVNAAFTQMTGLDFEKDVLNWMTGDYALFLGLNPQFDTTSQFGIFQTFPVNFGFAVEATDASQAQATVAGLTQAIETGVAQMGSSESETEVAITSEDIGGANVTVVTITAEDAPWPVELLMGANDEVFALGTRDAVRAILAPDGGLPSNAEFTRTSGYILPNAISVGWLNTEGLLPLADLASTFSQSETAEEEAEQARTAIGLFSSGTVSSAYDEAGNSLARLTLTFSE
jgi:hypothetical protein